MMTETKAVPTVAERLVEFREKAQLTIQEIVDRTGLSRSGIDKIESGRSSPTVKTVDVYVKACNGSLADFFKPFRN